MELQSLAVVSLFCLLVPSLQVPPSIAPLTTKNLAESAPDNFIVTCVPCLHSSTISVSILSVTVAQGVGNQCTSCFTARQVSPTSDYCIIYHRNFLSTPPEALIYAQAQRYIVKLVCTDGTESAQGDVDLRIIANSAPQFTQPVPDACLTINAITTPANAVVYNSLNAADVDGDTLSYSMVSDPVNDIFDIQTSTGVIYAKKPADSYCYNTVDFYVSVTDGTTAPVGPVKITCPITNHHTSPTITGLNQDVYIDEDVAVGTAIYSLPVLIPAPVLSISNVLPPTSSPLFTVAAGRILQVAAPLDFEDATNRDPNITLVVSNTYCASTEYYLHVHLRDKNDPPKVTPTSVVHTQTEGSFIYLSPGLSIVDQDDFTFGRVITAAADVNMWSFTPGGDLISVVTYDVETLGPVASLTLKVSDTKGGLSEEIFVTITVTDINDNRPIFDQTVYSYTVSECDPPGKVLGSLTATDKDISSPNNVIIYDVVSMGSITVDAAGTVTILSNVSMGVTTPVEVGCRDNGSPQLISPWKATVQLVVTECAATTQTNAQSSGEPITSYMWTQIATLLAMLGAVQWG
ncbi:protein dachsous-like [Haliotis rufescens]|uniref:protein dachsous-like n=1 Tax=Haliotis rufescens TaxID=6454 RepID=UPI00201F4F50|nr:protein dachsous-like [Haliotis rufescens]